MPFKIAFLDDEPTLCEIFKLRFESDELEIHTFSAPDELLAMLPSLNPDLVLLDLFLPGATGLEVAERLPAHVKKVLVTGDGEISGGEGFLKTFHKPFSFSEMEAFLSSQAQAQANSTSTLCQSNERKGF